MEVSQQLMNMVFELGSKEIMLGYVSKAVFIVKGLGICEANLFDFLAEERGEIFY